MGGGHGSYHPKKEMTPKTPTNLKDLSFVYVQIYKQGEVGAPKPKMMIAKEDVETLIKNKIEELENKCLNCNKKRVGCDINCKYYWTFKELKSLLGTKE